MADQVNSVLIVGGGTAGWITAAKLAKQLNSIDPSSVQVTLVESPDIPIIGVGEGTWPTMRKTLESLGIDEAEFIRECDATFKQATKFVNWQHAANNGQNNHYFHLFGSIFNPEEFNLSPYWDVGLAGEGVSYAQAVGAQEYLCELGLGPKKITTPAYQGLQNYAYHLNAGKFSEFIRKHAVSKLGVKHLKANVQSVNLDSQGYIASVDTDLVGVLQADFFIDCSGFKSLLLGDALGVKFKSINDVLLNDTAVVMQVPFESQDSEIRPYTTSTAQECGWIWDIGLQERRGVGYVYSSAHSGHDQADDVLRQYVGAQADQLDSRKIDMQIGYREKYWHKNCLAVGMSAAFIEPLEASAIFLVEAAGNMLADQFPRSRHEMAIVEKKFNRSFHFRWQKSIDFIKMHYMLSKREDSQYWLDSRRVESAPDSLLELMDHWRSHPPSHYDFDSVFEPFVLESYQFVWFGMNAERDYSCKHLSFANRDMAAAKFKQVQQAAKSIAGELPAHRELIEKIKKYGLSKM